VKTKNLWPASFLALTGIFILSILSACNHRCDIRDRSGRGHEVTAQGYGTIKAIPDVQEWALEVEFARPTMSEAVTETQKVVDAALKACAKAIPDSNDIQTLRIYTRKEYQWENGKNVFKGYAASQSIEIKLRDFSKTESLTEDLINAGVTSMNGPSFSHSKADSLHKEAMALAMVDAKTNAGRMCQSVNLKCDELVSAKENPIQESPAPMLFAKASNMDMGRAEGTGLSVKPGIMSFSAAVEATYRGK